MANSKQRGTNAADSAPGVNDGRARNAVPDHSKAGRRWVWLGIALTLLILLAIFISRPLTTSRGGDQMVTTGTTEREVAESAAPGAANQKPGQRP
jgi:ferric-dicitrate binding protein FerR (iron transport regulator)